VDCELIERARHGDVAGYGELVRRYQTLAFRAAYLVTGDAAEAEDVTQEAFVRAFRSLESFRSGSPFRPWLLRIVTNEALSRRRSAQRRVRLERRVFEAEPGDRQAGSPEAELIAGERRQELASLLAGMKDKDRIVLTYRYVLDMPVDEMAQALDCPESTVRTRISRALARLREQLIEQTEESRHE
jgi:RNA polymerase sigma-70 factor (ECF subfamily)